MGFRFRKSITLLPWVRLNLTASGLSLTLGPKGKSISIGTGGVYGNLRIGKGLSYRTRLLKGLPSTRRTRAFRKFLKYVMTAAVIAFALYRLSSSGGIVSTDAQTAVPSALRDAVKKGAELIGDKLQTQRSNGQNE